MLIIQDVADFLHTIAPLDLAEDWDNVGLLVGDPTRDVRGVMTCLTITPATVEEAVQRQADLIVTHHPLPFRALKRLTTEQTPSRLLLHLIEAKVAVYSPHTAWDSAAAGINQRLAAGLGLKQIGPLRPAEDSAAGCGAGRWGDLPASIQLAELAERLISVVSARRMNFVGTRDQPVQRVAVACGSAGEFLADAQRLGADVLVLGETSFHTCLEAEAQGVALLLPGHFASERFALNCLADELTGQFPELEVWAAERERDPVQRLESADEPGRSQQA